MYAFFSILTIVLISIVFLLSLEERKLSRTLQVWLFFCFSIFSVVLLSIRGFGLDYRNYKAMYSRLNIVLEPELLLIQDIEPLYATMNAVFRAAGSSFGFFYFSFNLMALLLIFIAYGKKYWSLKVLFIFLVLYYISYMDVTRAFMASCIFMLSIRFLSEKKYILSFFVLAITPFAHYSAFVLVPFIFFIRFKFTIISYFTLLCLSLISGLLFDSNAKSLAGLFQHENNVEFVRSGINYLLKGSNSPKDGFFNYTHVISWFSITAFVPIFAIIVNAVFLFKSSEAHDTKILYFHRLSCWGTLIFVFFVSANSIVFGNRIYFLLSLGLPIILIELIRSSGGRKKKKSRHVRAGYCNLEYVVWSFFMILGFIFVFSYVASFHVEGTFFYLGI
jgi:hypothetical protein